MDQANVFWDDFLPALMSGLAKVAALLLVTLVGVKIRQFLKSRGVPIESEENTSEDGGSGSNARLFDLGRRHQTREESEVIIDGKPHKTVKTSKTVVGGFAGFVISNGKGKGKQTIEGTVGSITLDDGTTEIKGQAGGVKTE